jgi:quercetin dioxygenase-like cupin family protein
VISVLSGPKEEACWLGGRKERTVRLWLSKTHLAVLALFVASALFADEKPPVRVVTPADLKWEASPRAPGVLIAVLMGDPSKPEAYIMRAKYPANTMNGPHHHPVDEQITVLSGTWYMGQGETIDPAKATPLIPGTFVFEPANAWHWTLTKSEAVEVEIHGIGPRTNVYAR